MFSILKNKIPKTISHQLITPLKRLAFSLLMAFSLFSYSANDTEIKPIAFFTIDPSAGIPGTTVKLISTNGTPFTGDDIGNITFNGDIIVTTFSAADNSLTLDIPCTAVAGPTPAVLRYNNGADEQTFNFTVTLNGTISGGGAICAGGAIAKLTWSGANAAVATWQSLGVDAGAFWEDVEGSGGNNEYTPLTLETGSNKFRVKGNNGACAAPSAVAEIRVTAPALSGTLSVDEETVCEGSTVNLTLNDHFGTITKWQSKPATGTTWTDITNTTTTHTTGALTETTDIRVLIENGVCPVGGTYSPAQRIIVKKAPVVTISSSLTTICSGTSADFSVTITKGIIYGWESSNFGTNWTPYIEMTRITPTTYRTGEINRAMQFRAILTSSDGTPGVTEGVCGINLKSNSVGITLVPAAFAGGVTATATNICQASPVTLSLDVNGQTGTIVRWESSTDDFNLDNSSIATIPGTPNLLNLNPTVTKAYRAVVQNETCTVAYSNKINIIVNATTVAGTVFGGSPICLNAPSGELTLRGQTGVVTIWQRSIDAGANWTDIPGSGAMAPTSYDPGPGQPTQTTSYRAKVRNGACTEEPSAATEVIVRTPVGGDLSTTGAATVCPGGNIDITLSGETGTVSEWQSKSPTDTEWTTLFTTSEKTINTGNLFFSTLYRAKVIIGECVDYSRTKQISISVLPAASIGLQTNIIICENGATNIGAQEVTGSSYNWVANPTYTWSGSQRESANPNVSPSVTTIFTLTETNAAGCQSSNSVTVSIKANPTVSFENGLDLAMCEEENSVFINANITGPTGWSTRWSVEPTSAGVANEDPADPSRANFIPTDAGIAAGRPIVVKLKVWNSCDQDPDNTVAEIQKTITINRQSVANAGADATVCGTNPITLDGSASTFTDTYAWSGPPNMTGSLAFANTATPVYTPDAGDVLNFPSGVTFTLTTSKSGETCSTSSNSVVVTITASPIISAGPNEYIISESEIYIPIATEQNTLNLSWSSNGNGTFTNRDQILPTYSLGTDDIANGTVTLTLTANGNSPCTPAVTSETILTIKKDPTIEPIANSVVCASPTNPIRLSATITDPGTLPGDISWTVVGPQWGTFNNTDTATPSYTPGNEELNATIEFLLTVKPIVSRGRTATRNFIYTIKTDPIIEAGDDDDICINDTTRRLNGRSKKPNGDPSTSTTTAWTSTGTGTFDDRSSPTATYTFSSNDYTNPTITFTLTGTQTNCDPVSDVVIYTFVEIPVVTAGAPQTICAGEPVTLNGTETNTVSTIWSTSGNMRNFYGTENSLTPTYTPDPGETGTISFSIQGNAIDPCLAPTDLVRTSVTFVEQRTVEAGNNATICEGDNYTIPRGTASVTNFNGNVTWSGGTGVFIAGNTLEPTYRPTAADIEAGFVILTLTAPGIAPCTPDPADQIILTISKKPSITFTNQILDVCTGRAPFAITGVNVAPEANATDNIQWTRIRPNGSEVITVYNTLNPIYIPEPEDLDADGSGSVFLRLRITRTRNTVPNCTSIDEKTIELKYIPDPTGSAGPDATICSNDTYTTTSATAFNYSEITWSSTGTGSWNGTETNLNAAAYTPSLQDITNGSVTLTLRIIGDSSCFALVQDTLTLNFEALSVITTSNGSICKTSDTFQIAGTEITNDNNIALITLTNWTSSGTGTFSPGIDPADIKNPIYNASEIDLAGTSVTLTLNVTPLDPCAPQQSETLILSIIPEPIASAGVALSQCETPFTITTATADTSTYSRLEWTSDSGGAFDGGINNVINPTYIPSANDILTGTVNLTLTAFAIDPCTDPNISTIAVSIEKEPEITVTNQNPICEDAQNTVILGATVLNAASFIYTSTTGTIIFNETTRTPTVTPSALDITNGFITLTITADANGACLVPVTKTITITIERNPIVTAGAASTICEGDNITTNDATALFVDTGNLQWSNNGGDGIFTTASNTLVTNYTPGTIDILNGQVQLTLTGTATLPCLANSVATVTHTIVKKPTLVINPSTATICEDQVYQVTPGQVAITHFTNVASIEWSASSPGTISTTGIKDLEPTFTPSAADITNGFSILTAEVTPIGSCAAATLTETIRVNITKNPTIDISGNRAGFCDVLGTQLTATFTDHDDTKILWEVVSGTGSIVNADKETAEYIPDADSETVVIEVSVTGNTPCATPVSQQITLNKIRKPEVTLPENTKIICSSESTINIDALVTNTTINTTYQWTSSNGSITFGNSTNEDTSYTFTQADKDNGEVTLILTATSDVDCALTGTDNIVITIVPAPTVTITNLATEICLDNNYSARAEAENATTYLWDVVGVSDGTFVNASLLNTQYIPGANDILNGVFTIQITATGNAICTPVTTSTTVNIIPKPTITFAADSGETCTATPYSIQGVLVTNYSTLTWTSRSNIPRGTFSNPTIENPTYTPSPEEKASNNPIILRLTAVPNDPCDATTTTIFQKDFTLNLLPVQTADAGDPITICEGAVVPLNGASTNDVSQYWTSSSTGTTVFATSKTATYTPNTLDINNGTVTLTLHAVSNRNCDEVTDTVIITILKQPTANAGPTVTICEDDTSYTLLNGEATVTNETSYQWSISGPATITAGTENTLTPEIIPNTGASGNITLTLTALADTACGSLSDAIATKTIRIIPKPNVIIIPTTGVVCEGEDFVIIASDIITSDFNTLNWTSSNNLGTFIPNAVTGETIYRPAVNETGAVTLTLTATATDAACADASANLVLTINPSVIVEAGSNASICENENYTINDASITNGNGVYNWSISGPATITAGTETTLTPQIVPNTGASGTITLTLVGNGSATCATSAQDTVAIIINALPIVDAGTPLTVCQGVTEIPLVGAVSNSSDYLWSQAGGAGTLVITPNPLEPKYIPAAADFINPTGQTIVTIFLVAEGIDTCTNVTDSMTITLQANPTVYAGVDVIACKDDVIDLNTATASNFDTILWSTNGNGTFNYTTAGGVINPTYTLGSNDNSSVILTMTATPNGACNTNSSATITITVNQEPTILATQNVFNYCETTFTLPDVITVSNSSGYLWTNTTVVGTRSTVINPTSETPIITPTQNEINNGFVLLTLTAQPNTPCTSVATETIRINLMPEVIVEAGDDKTVCATDNLINLDFLNASVSSSNYNWTTDGAGTITGRTSLQPQYQRGVNETGAIVFTLSANNIAPCTGEEIDTVTLNIDPLATADAGSNITICEGSDINITDASSTNASSIEWIASSNISGTPRSTGRFLNGNTITPSYQPSLNDIQNGIVYLIIRATNTNSCSTEVASSYMELTIAEGAGVFAGSNAKICADDTYELTGAVANNSSNGVTWSAAQNTNGTSSGTYISGTFSNLNSINPTYTPSTADINLGHVYLFIEGSGASTCPVTNSSMRLDIASKPSITTQEIVNVCVDTPSITLSSTPENYKTITWSVFSGPGTLFNVNDRNPTFTHGVATTITTPQTTILKAILTPNDGCDSSEQIIKDVSITITPIPTGFAGDDGEVCYVPGQPIPLFTINNTNVSNASTLTWTTDGSGAFSSGSRTTYQSFSNTCPIIENLTLTAIGECGTSEVIGVVQLTINCEAPNLGTITSNYPAPQNICQETDVLYEVPANVLTTTYNWTVPTGATITSPLPYNNSIMVTYGENSTSGIVTVAASNGCGTGPTSTFDVTISPILRATTISGPTIICQSDLISTYTAAPIIDATGYKWTWTDGITTRDLGTTTTNTLDITAATSLTSGDLQVIGISACGDGITSAPFGITVSINAILSSATPSDICSGIGFNYIPTSASSGVSFVWQRAIQSGISGSASGTGDIVNDLLENTTTNSQPVTYEISLTNSNGCISTESITVNVLPVAQFNNTPDTEICSGGTFNFVTTTNITGAVSWSRAAVAGILEAGNANTGNINEVLTNTTNAVVSVIYEVVLPDDNGCANTMEFSVDVLPKPSDASSISGPISVCNPSINNIYSVTPIANATLYEWELDGVIIDATAANEISINFTGNTSRVLRVRGTNSCTNGEFSDPLTINTVVTPTLSNNPINSEICSNESFSYIPTSISATIFNWDRASLTGIATPSSTGIGAINEILVNTTTAPIRVLYTYTLVTAEGCTNTETVAVTVNPSPLILNSPVTSICSGSNFVFTPLLDAPSSISWRRIPIANITGGAATGTGGINDPLINLTSAIIPVTYEITLINNTNNCQTIETIVVNVNPLPTATIESSATTCFNSNDSFINFKGENGVTPYTFTYTLDGGPQTTISTNGIETSAQLPLFSDAVGTYVYRLISVEDSSDIACEHTFAPTDASKSISVEIFEIPTLEITQPNAICELETIDIRGNTYISDFDANLIYTYWRDFNTTLAFLTPESATGGTYYIKAENTNGCSVTKPILVQEKPLPSTQIGIGLDEVFVCEGSDVVLNATGAVSYNWYRLDATGTPVTLSTNIVYTHTATTNEKIYLIGTSANSCSSTSEINITLVPAMKAGITDISSNEVCVQAAEPTITFTAENGTAPYTFTYTIGGNVRTITSIGTSNSAVLPISTNVPGVFNIVLTGVEDGVTANCERPLLELPINATITVFKPEIIPTTPATIFQTICEAQPINTIEFDVSPNAVSGYVEGLPNNVTAIFSNITDKITISGTSTETGIFEYTVFSSIGTNCTSTYTGRITINSDSNIVAPLNKDQTICSCGVITPIEFELNQDTFGATVSGLPDGLDWNIINNIVTISGNSCDTSGDYVYTVSPQGLCTNTPISGKITITNISPIQVTSGNQNEALCINTTLTDVVYQAGIGETLNFIGVLPAGITFVENPALGLATLSGTPENSGIYDYTITSDSVCSTAIDGSILVNQNPLTQIENGLDEVFVCEGSEVVLNATGAASYNWYRLDATGTPVTLSTNDVYTYTPTTNEKIYLIGTSANGCSSNSEINISLLPAIKARITGITSHEVCVQAVEPMITFTAENGTAPYTFTYTIGGNVMTITSIGTSNSAVLPISTNVPGVFNIVLTGVEDAVLASCGNPLLELPINATVTVLKSEITPATPATIFQTICEAQPINTIEFDVSPNAVSGYVEGLPNNVTAIFSNITDKITISGTSTETGIFEYTVFSSVGTNCTSTYTGTITINSDSNIVAPLNKDQTICSCGIITPIEFELNEDTFGATVSGLPDGLDWSVINNIVTISGNSCDTSGDYIYTVSPQGFCTNTPISGKITITNISPIQVTSGNQNETLCINTTLTDVVYQAGIGETLRLVGVLPAGIAFVENPALGLATLSGAPENSGIYNYTIISDSACSESIDGSILVKQDPFYNLMAGSISQVSCVNSPIETIRYQIDENITDVNFIPVLPDGISYAINNEQLIISGTPSLAQVNTTYTFNSIGSCNDTLFRQINLEFTEETTINLEAGSGLATQSVCQNAPIEPIQFTLLPLGTQVNQSILPSFINVTEIDPFTGLWEITGTPLSTGIFNFVIESINSLNCSVSLPIQIENVFAAINVDLESGSDNQTLCNFSSPIENIVYKITGNIPNINIISVEGLPNGVTLSKTTILNGLLLTISGQSNETGTFNYEIVYDNCGVIQNGFIKTSSLMSINGTVTQTTCIDDASIDLNIFGGVPYVDDSGDPYYNINWVGPDDFRQNQLSIVNLAPGDYTVNVTDAIGCGLLQTKTFTIEPLLQLSINLMSTSLANGCSQELGCANFEFEGGSEIYTTFLLESLDPQTQIWREKNPLNNNYLNICGLDIGLYRLSITDSRGCTTEPYMFNIDNDNQFLIESIVVQDSLCEGNDGSIIVEVRSLDPNLTFTYNGDIVSSIELGDNTYELQIIGSDVATGILEIIDTSGCSISKNIKMKTLNSDFEYTSFEFENSGYFDVNESIEFTNMSFVEGEVFDPSIYSKITWDFDDNTPFKTFSYPDDMAVDNNGENIQTVFHTFRNDGIYNVTLTSFNDAGCSVSVNKTIIIGTASSVSFPTVFSPNNDGINDFFNPTFRGFTEFTMFIYDGLGNLIFEFTSTDAITLENDNTWGWNGIEGTNTTPKSGHYRCYFSGKTIRDKVIEKNVRFLIVK